MMEAGAIILLDVRPTGEFEAGHIPGAISVPIDEIDAYIQKLPLDIEVATYRGVQKWRDYSAMKPLD